MTSFVFKGSSGQNYSYELHPAGVTALLPTEAGNYILATGTPANPRPVLIVSADNVRSAVQAMPASDRDVALQVYGVNLLYVHLEPDPTTRQTEKDDLLREHDPAMNRP